MRREGQAPSGVSQFRQTATAAYVNLDERVASEARRTAAAPARTAAADRVKGCGGAGLSPAFRTRPLRLSAEFTDRWPLPQCAAPPRSRRKTPRRTRTVAAAATLYLTRTHAR